MTFQEVEKTFFQYEDQKHEIIQKTQKHFLKKGYSLYIWFDELHRLRLKHKYQRGNEFLETKGDFEERTTLINMVEEFADKNNLYIHYILEQSETDNLLPENIQKLWSTEFILEVKQWY